MYKKMISILRFLRTCVLGPPASKVQLLMRLRIYAQNKNSVWLLRWCSDRLQKFGIFIHPEARIGHGTKLPHPTGIVIGKGVVVEDHVRIFQNVTLGGARMGDYENNRYPKIGSGTTIFAGAVIVGDLEIGPDCTIGANSLVLHDVPKGSVAVGAPARNSRLNKS